MDFNTYEQHAASTAIYPNRGSNLPYAVLGLAGETGEVAEKVKKLLRGDRVMDDDYRQLIKKELGDVLWYIAAVCHETGLSMDEVAEANVRKLASRKERGLLHGEGDNR